MYHSVVNMSSRASTAELTKVEVRAEQEGTKRGDDGNRSSTDSSESVPNREESFQNGSSTDSKVSLIHARLSRESTGLSVDIFSRGGEERRESKASKRDENTRHDEGIYYGRTARDKT